MSYASQNKEMIRETSSRSDMFWSIRNKSGLVIFVTLIILFYTLFSILDFFEFYYYFTRNYEDWELDELALSAVLAAAVMGWYSWRKARQSTRQCTRLRVAEAAIRDSEARFEALIDNCPAVIAVKDLEGRYVLVNEAFESRYGLSRHEVLGRTTREAFPGEAAERVEFRDKTAIEEGNRLSSMIEDRNLQGDLRTHFVTRFPFRDRTGAVAGVGRISIDMTEHKRAEDALRESEERFRNLVDGSIQGMYIERNLKPVFANEACAEIFGFEDPDDFLLLDSVLDLHPAGAREQARALNLARMDGQAAPEVYEIEGQRLDGSIICLEQRVRVVNWEGAPATQVILIDITERKRAERALRESEQLLRAIIDHSPAAIYLKDAEGRYQVVNRTYRRNFGLTEDMPIGLTARDFIPERQIEDILAQDREVMQSRRVRNYERLMPLPDGRVLTEWVVKFPVFDSEGNVTGLGGVSTDITERKIAEEALRESQDKFRTIFENAGVGMAVVAADGTYQDVNEHFCAILGRAREELLGMSFRDVTPPDDTEKTWVEHERIFRGQKDSFATEKRYRRPDGSTVWVNITMAPLRTGNGLVRSMISAVHDITERKQAEEALRRSEEDLRGILDNMIDTFYRTGTDGRFVMASPSVRRLLGLDVEEILGRRAAEFHEDPEGRPKLLRALDRNGGIVQDYVVRARRADGRLVWISLNARYLRGEDGMIAGVEGVLRDVTDQIRTKKALQKSEALHKEAQRIARVGHWEWDIRNNKVRWSDEYRRIVGRSDFTPDFGVRKAIDTVVHPDDRRRVHDILDDAIARTGNYDAEFRIVQPGGSIRHVHTRAEVKYDKEGCAERVLGTTRDITHHKLAEDALRESENRIRLLLDSTGDGIYGIDREGRCIICNQASIRLLGYRKESDLLGKDLHALIHGVRADGKSYPIEECPAHIAIQTGKAMHAEDELLLRADGTGIPVDYHAYPLRRGEDIIGAVVRFDDVSARRQAERDLRKLSTAVEQSPAAILIAGPKGNIEYVNPRFELMTGHTLEEVQGWLLEWVNRDPVDPDRFNRMWEAVEAGGAWRGEVCNLRKNGEVYWAATSLAPVIDSAGKTINVLQVAEDISEKRRMDEQLQHAQKMEAIGQLTGGIAHDFNNILAVILTNLECLEEELPEESPGQDEQEEILDAAIRAVHRGADLTQRLLAFSRRQYLKPEPLNLAHVVSEMVDMLRRSLGETITIKTEFAGRSHTAMVDHNQFENAILNLAVNARDAMPHGGKLNILVKNVTVKRARPAGTSPIEPGRYVGVEVTDTGTGMTQDVVDRACEPFFTTKRTGAGSGLGLSMVYGFVRQSGGYLVIESEVGAGTSVKLLLPATRAPRKPRTSKPGKKPRPAVPDISTNNARILAVEDDPAVRASVKGILESLGYEVILAENGHTALETLQQRQDIDLLFTDIVMPGGMSGKDLASEARKLSNTLKIILTSGYSAGHLSERDLIDEEAHFISKPYSRDKLADAIRDALANGADRST